MTDYNGLTRDEACDIFSDLYKDVHGRRPRFCADWTVADYEAQIAELEIEADKFLEAEAKRQAESVKTFEAYVARTIAIGAGDRVTAMRWIHAAEDTDSNDDRLCWELDLPYGYISNHVGNLMELTVHELTR